MAIVIIEFPGSFGAAEMLEVCERGFNQKAVRVWHQEARLPANTEALIIPGGASFGDYLRPGALARGSQIVSVVKKFAREGGPVLGIGNGFQILCEIEALPGALLPNAGLRFVNHEAHMMIENGKTRFTEKYREGQVLKLPLACSYGRYYGDKRVIEDLEEGDRVLFRYCDKFGDVDMANPYNGNRNNIAGISSRNHNVLGLMVHPERACGLRSDRTDGKGILEGLFG